MSNVPQARPGRNASVWPSDPRDYRSARVVGRVRLVRGDGLAELRAGLVAAFPVVLGTAEGLAGGLAAGGAERRGAHGISRTMMRFVAPGVPVRRPAVMTTVAPVGRPAASRATESAASIISSTLVATPASVG